MIRLRVAYAGHDFFSSCLKTLIDRSDIEVVTCLTSGPGKSVDNVLSLAHKSKIPVLFGRPTRPMVSRLNESRIDLLISAAYLYRIPIESLTVGRAVNVHPSLLPEGRGPNPLPYLVDGHREQCGISIHEMTPEFDMGPILLQERIPLAESDGFDQLFLKLFAAAPRLLNTFLDGIDEFFSAKREQGAGSYWPKHDGDQRTIAAEQAKVGDALAMHAKFGTVGVIVRLVDGRRIETQRLVASECEHRYPPGSVIAQLHIGWIVALTNGLMRVSEPSTLGAPARS
ncbi:MAG TPA: formyltransferase family protein [Actinophytocola sp.]|jgi:methionyl-tRNA formyltransferase|uniref:formyltransferase family protein n=1 Tax=Actinophytocola sp. TaxID=1872138 RepID=UPI002E0A3901|nr:formyltransferase family protein [Actinophytocola sp.]